MYSDENSLINKCAETMKGQLALNVSFVESMLKSQSRWVNQAFDQQQQLQTAVLKSEDLTQVSENTKACIEGIAKTWLADCESAFQVLQQQGEEVANLYGASKDSSKVSTAEQKIASPVVTNADAKADEKTPVKRKQPVSRKPATKKAAVKKVIKTVEKTSEVVRKQPSTKANVAKSDSAKPATVNAKAATVKAPKAELKSIKQPVSNQKAPAKAKAPLVADKKPLSATAITKSNTEKVLPSVQTVTEKKPEKVSVDASNK